MAYGHVHSMPLLYSQSTQVPDMKNRLIAAALLMTCLSPAAHADLILGVKSGPMLVSFDEVESDSDPINAGLTFGYQFDTGAGRFGVEAEITRSVAAGKVADTDLEVESQGIYATYATRGPLYFKGKVGIMEASLVAGDLSEDEGGETYGVGVGMRLGLFRVELEYTAIDDDVSFVSVGLIY